MDVFCSRVCKERIKHNHISPTGLGRIDTHTQMHRHTHPTLEKVAIVAQMTHLIFFGSLIQDNLSKIPQTKKKCSRGICFVRKGEPDDILSQIT